jgi:superoxide dismutase, Fe-Mn family
MQTFEEQKFDIPKLTGISEKTIEEHLKLYAGYVKNANLIGVKLGEMMSDQAKPSTGVDGRSTPAEQEFREKNTYAMTEISRRFSFEYNGMRNHEIYFSSLVGGSSPISTESELHKLISKTWGSFDAWMSMFKMLAMTRGIGWAMLWYDKKDGRLLFSWVDEQHLGQLQGCSPIIALDMWEHSFVADYQPSGKKQYVEDFFANLNWSVVEENFTKALS